MLSVFSAFQRFSGSNGQRVAMRQEGVVYYLHSDHLGSTSVLSDGSGQQAGDRVAYLPYGGARLGDASTLPTDYTFTGQRNEAGIGLMHYGARFYSPRLGRFVSADSIVPSPLNPQDFNRYTYGRNNPLVYIDADGHFPVPVLIALAVAAAGIAFFRTPACAGEGCAPGTSSNSPEYQVKSYATAAETAVEVYFGAKLLAVQLGAETLRDENRDQKEAVEEVVEGAGEAIEQGAKEGSTPPKPYSDPRNRPSYADGQVEEVWENAKGPDGKVYDPFTGEELHWDKTRSRTGQWDMGHKPGHEYKKLWQDYVDDVIDLETFLEEYQDPSNYFPQSTSSNRSHRFEQ